MPLTCLCLTEHVWSLSPATPCSSFPRHEGVNQHWTKTSRIPTKTRCANRNAEVVEGCAVPAFYSPSLSCHSWSHLLVKPHNTSPPKHDVSSSAWISVKKQTDENATPNKFISSGTASCRELSANQSLTFWEGTKARPHVITYSSLPWAQYLFILGCLTALLGLLYSSGKMIT